MILNKFFCRHRKGTFVDMGWVRCARCNKWLYTTLGLPTETIITEVKV